MLSLFVTNPGRDLRITQHAQHRPKPRLDGGLICDIAVYSSAVAFIHVTLPAPSRVERTSR